MMTSAQTQRRERLAGTPGDSTVAARDAGEWTLVGGMAVAGAELAAGLEEGGAAWDCAAAITLCAAACAAAPCAEESVRMPGPIGMVPDSAGAGGPGGCWGAKCWLE